jgi:2,4-dienoyl-CoA reductase-like NADH-dependent reductase (Old Yellow Enzyme family)/thioredoxin reductase
LFENLFKHLSIKGGAIKNRIVMPAMNTNFADLDGHVTQKMIDYYAERAKGGVGLIIASAAYIDPTARKRRGGLAIYDDKFVPGLKKLSKAIKNYDCYAVQQINHNGRLLASSSVLKTNVDDQYVVAPSAIPHRVTGTTPRELSIAEIRLLIKKFVEAARRADLAGFNGVELNGAHGYLLGQFLSPYSNKRKDIYGGTWEKRLKFPLDVVKAIRKNVAEEFLLIYRISAKEFIDGGLDIEEAKIFSNYLEKNGVDILNVTGGINESPGTMLYTIPLMSAPKDRLYKLAGEIKPCVRIPVIAVGRINSPELAEDILISGKADMIATGRALICDPFWPKKARVGKSDEIRKCIACNQGCMERISQEKDLTCLLNPQVGREGMEDLRKSRKRKNVFIIGGGPAGMEAAITASTRGHRVSLFEKEKELGGQGDLAARAPGKEQFKLGLDYLRGELKRKKVAIIRNRKISARRWFSRSPEAVIVATGATCFYPPIPGIDKDFVLTAWDVLRGRRTGKRVLVMGGGLVGAETSLFLAQKNKKVFLIEKLNEIVPDAGILNRTHILMEIKEKKIDVRCNTEVIEIVDKLAICRRQKRVYRLGIDTIVLAVGSKPQNGIYEVAIKKGLEAFKVGDCATPRKMLEAIHEGYEIGRRI